MVRAPTLAACVVVGLLAATTSLVAQQRSVITGQVRNSITLGPLAGARVTLTRLSGTDTSIVTREEGSFRFQRLPPGRYVIRATWGAMASPVANIDLADREQVEVEFTVGPPRDIVLLPEATVEASPEEIWLSRLEDRRTSGLGQVVTRDQLEVTPASTVSSVVASLRGVAQRCTNSGCIPFFPRARPSLRQAVGAGGRPATFCAPQYYLDEQLVDWQAINSLRLNEVEAIEAYQGLTQVPFDLGANPGKLLCGVFIVWTRRPALDMARRRP